MCLNMCDEQGMTVGDWQLQFVFNDYPWLTAAKSHGGDLRANGTVSGSPVQVTVPPSPMGAYEPLTLTGRYVEQDDSFPFQTLSLGIQRVFINKTPCAEVSAPRTATSSADIQSVLAVLGADSCYLPLIESRVVALNASSIEEAQKILSPLCSQQFCCAPAPGPAQGPAPLSRPGFSFLPGPARAPQSSAAAVAGPAKPILVGLCSGSCSESCVWQLENGKSHTLACQCMLRCSWMGALLSSSMAVCPIFPLPAIVAALGLNGV